MATPSRCTLVRLAYKRGLQILCAGTYRECRARLHEDTCEPGITYVVLASNACEAFDWKGARIELPDFAQVATAENGANDDKR